VFDPLLNRLVRPPLRVAAKACKAVGISANQVTVAGFVLGLLAVPAIASRNYEWALFFIVLNRIADGLDGALARVTKPTDAGGFLDITFDFIFYSAIVFGFLLVDPLHHAFAAGLLMVTFMGTGASFLAFAIMASKHNLENPSYPSKSMHYMGGITEGGETIAAFVLMCLFPEHFVVIALVFALLCWVTAITRIWFGFQTLRSLPRAK